MSRDLKTTWRASLKVNVRMKESLILEFFLRKTKLQSLGEVAQLRFLIDENKFNSEMKTVEDLWFPYNPRKKGYNRYGLSLTSLDGEVNGGADLDSILEYNRENETHLDEMSFKIKTKAYEKITALHKILDYFGEDLGRTHILKLNKGGFFPPHRDSLFENDPTFRVLIPFMSDMPHTWTFILNSNLVNLSAYSSYYVDTAKEHSVFSYKDNCMLLVMNIKASESSLNKIFSNLLIT